MKMMKKLSQAARGAVASTAKMAPAMAGAVAKAAQPKSAATITNQSDLARAAADHFASSNKMQPALGGTGGIRGAMQSGALKAVDAATASKFQKDLASVKANPINNRPVDIASKKIAPAISRTVAKAAKPSIGAALQKKPVGKVIGRGLLGKR